MKSKYITRLKEYRDSLIEVKKNIINKELSEEVEKRFEPVVVGKPKVKVLKREYKK